MIRRVLGWLVLGGGWVLVTCPMLYRLLNKVLGGQRLRIAGSVSEALQQISRDN